MIKFIKSLFGMGGAEEAPPAPVAKTEVIATDEGPMEVPTEKPAAKMAPAKKAPAKKAPAKRGRPAKKGN